MKYFFMGCLLAISFSLFAQDDERSLDAGTTFTYVIKDGKLSYKLIATRKQWDYDTIKFGWQTTAPKVAKGTVTMDFGAIGESNKIKIKPKAGNVVLPKDVCGWILPYDVFDSLFNRQLTTKTSVDGVPVKLKPGKINEEYQLKYNATMQKVLYGEGGDDSKEVKLAFIEFLNDIIFVSYYRNGNFFMTLESVVNTKKKTTD